MRKQNLAIEYKEACQAKLKKIILQVVKKEGLYAAKYQIEWLEDHPGTMLPTSLNHRETLRIYQLTLEDLNRKKLKNGTEAF